MISKEYPGGPSTIMGPRRPRWTRMVSSWLKFEPSTWKRGPQSGRQVGGPAHQGTSGRSSVRAEQEGAEVREGGAAAGHHGGGYLPLGDCLVQQQELIVERGALGLNRGRELAQRGELIVLLSEGVSCAGGRRGPGAARSAERMCIEAASMSAARAAATASASSVCTATGSLGAAGPAPSARLSGFVEPGEVSSADGGASGKRVRA